MSDQSLMLANLYAELQKNRGSAEVERLDTVALHAQNDRHAGHIGSLIVIREGGASGIRRVQPPGYIGCLVFFGFLVMRIIGSDANG